MILGITGGTGCGKTTLLKLIAEQGGLILDCDAIYHELLATDNNLLDAIEARFPGTVENGTLQRKKLGALVFSDSGALLDLNRITHGAVKREILRRLEVFLADDSGMCIFNVVLGRVSAVSVHDLDTEPFYAFHRQ